MKYLLAVGACYLDTILTVPHYPGEDEKLRAKSLVRRRGGNCPNTLEVLQQLLAVQNPFDMTLVYCGPLPAQRALATTEIEWSLPGVDLTHALYRKDCNEAASSYIIKSAASSSRTIVNYNELPEMTAVEFQAVIDQIGSDTMWCHFEGRIPDVTLDCIKYLKSEYPNIRVSVEVEKPGRPGLEEIAAEANLVFFSRSWAMNKGYSSAKACVDGEKGKCPDAYALCCTWGADGATAAVRTGKNSEPWKFIMSSSALPEGAEVVDTVGAGDTFIAGIMHGDLCDLSDESLTQSTMDFAVRLAGRKVTQEGFRGLGEILYEV